MGSFRRWSRRTEPVFIAHINTWTELIFFACVNIIYRIGRWTSSARSGRLLHFTVHPSVRPLLGVRAIQVGRRRRCWGRAKLAENYTL